MSIQPTPQTHDLTIETKAEAEHVEDQDMEAAKAGVRDVQYDDQEGGVESRKGLRRMLRRNPSYEFIREVALADEEPLDPVQVKGVSLATKVDLPHVRPLDDTDSSSKSDCSG